MSFPNKIYSLRDKPRVVRVISRVVPFRFSIIVSIHMILFSAAYLLAFSMLTGSAIQPGSESLFWLTLIPVVLIRLVVFWFHDLYQGLWRYVSFEDLLNIVRAAIISSGLFMIVGIFWRPFRLPQCVYALDWIFCVMLVGGIRFAVRGFRERYFPGNGRKAGSPILVVGPMGKVHSLVKELMSDPSSHYRPVAIVDPTRDESTDVMRMFDLPVWSTRQALARKSSLEDIAAIAFCWSEASKKEMEAVVEYLEPLQVPFKSIPRLEDILADRVKISDLRDVDIVDLLERPPIRIKMDQIRNNLRGKTILVSGGGGSIGSELCRQIAAFDPSQLVIVERSENSLYDLKLELRKRFPSISLCASISSVNDYQGMHTLIRKMKVDTVFHAAAYKHVPLMEGVPVESAYNNILGTYNLAKASFEGGVKRFVMISTDKAVSPTNVMGVTKRIAEMVVQSYNDSTQTRFMVVRFGNVLGSAGSVAPLFKKQIAEGGPVTVTHPEIERFFMIIPEAVQLILQAGSMGRGGEIFVLEMGVPVKIVKLAEKLITLSGKRPYRDVEIMFTGLRPGEKMYEELFNQTEIQIPTAHSQIMVARAPAVDADFVRAQIEEIRRMVLHRDEQALRKKFRELVPDYAPACEFPEEGQDVRDAAASASL